MGIDISVKNNSLEFRFAKVLILAAKIREDSFDQKSADKTIDENRGHCIDFGSFYRLSMLDASIKAVKDSNENEAMVIPIYLALKNTWNDMLEWADKQVKGNTNAT